MNRGQSSAAAPRRIGSVILGGWRAFVGFIGAAGTVFLILTVVSDATLRFVLNKPIPGTIEYVSYWYMVPIAFCGIALAERYGEHIDAPLIFNRLPEPLQREFALIGRLLFITVLLAITWWGWEEAVRQHEFGERGAAAGTVIWPMRYIVPLGALACTVEVLVNMFGGRRVAHERVGLPT